LITISQPFWKKCQKTSGGIFLTHAVYRLTHHVVSFTHSCYVFIQWCFSRRAWIVPLWYSTVFIIENSCPGILGFFDIFCICYR